jgi:hypothetical protein
MKFKVYEVKTIRIEDKDDYEESFLYAEYEDAVAKFKELIEVEKKVDWIEEGLASDDKRYELIENVDFWGFYAEDFWNDWKSEVSIIEREVF